MIAWLRILLVVFLYCSTALAAREQVPGLVHVSSSYKDQESGRIVHFSGYGTLIRVPEGTEFKAGYYVLTDHHLSGGQDLTLEVPDARGQLQSHEFAGRASDIELDTEVIELKDSGGMENTVFAVLDPKTQDFVVTPKATRSMEKILIGLDDDEAMPLPKSFRARFSNDLSRGQSRTIAPHFLLTHAIDRFDERISWSQGGFERKSPFRILPGMSGLPLLRLSEVEGKRATWILSGLALRFLRYMSGSYFSTPATYRELLRKLPSEERSDSSGPRWSLRKGVLYRELSKDNREIPWLANPSGNGLGSDGGNGLGSDGGSASGAEANKIPQGFLYEGKIAIGFRVRLKSCPRLQDNFWRTTYGRLEEKREPYHLNNGVFTSVSTEQDFYLWANLGALRFIRKNPECVRLMSVVRNGDDLLPILVGRLRQELAYGQRIQKEFELYNTRGDSMRVGPSGFSLKVPDEATKEMFYGEFSRTGAELGKRGGSFEPIVTLRSKRSQRTMVVDLRGLFFQDVEESTASHSLVYYGLIGADALGRTSAFKELNGILSQLLDSRSGHDFGSLVLDPRESAHYAGLKIHDPVKRRFLDGWLNESWFWFGLFEDRMMPTVLVRDSAAAPGGFSERVVPLSIFRGR